VVPKLIRAVTQIKVVIMSHFLNILHHKKNITEQVVVLVMRYSLNNYILFPGDNLSQFGKH